MATHEYFPPSVYVALNFRDDFVVGKRKIKIKGSGAHIFCYIQKDSDFYHRLREWLHARLNISVCLDPTSSSIQDLKLPFHVLPDTDIDEKEMNDFTSAWMFLNCIPDDLSDRTHDEKLNILEWALAMNAADNIVDIIADFITHIDLMKSSPATIARASALMEKIDKGRSLGPKVPDVLPNRASRRRNKKKSKDQ